MLGEFILVTHDWTDFGTDCLKVRKVYQWSKREVWIIHYERDFYSGERLGMTVCFGLNSLPEAEIPFGITSWNGDIMRGVIQE